MTYILNLFHFAEGDNNNNDNNNNNNTDNLIGEKVGQ